MMLRRAAFHPGQGATTIASLTFVHFTVARYASCDYSGTYGKPCSECVRLIQTITTQVKLAWAPKAPPGDFEEGARYRHLVKIWIDRFEDHELIQEGLSWFQYLIVEGKIWLFDALRPIEPVDSEADWS
ncbi:hypothetical protein N7488_008507 [Penicillium malachiteum]|nr:hypothetical protein N7488_008507 [Penicillium malachiteum]